MASNVRWSLYWLFFIVLWGALGDRADELWSALPIGWAVYRAVYVRGRRALYEDVRNQLRALRGEKCEALFLCAIPVLLGAAKVADKKYTEGILIHLSLIFVITHVPTIFRSLTPAALRKAIVSLAFGFSLAVLVSSVDVDVSTYASALFAPRMSACARPGHPLRDRIIALSDQLDSQSWFNRDLVHDISYRFGKLGEVPRNYTTLLIMFAFGQLATFSPRARRYLQAPLAAVVYAGMISALLKIFIHRERPMMRGDPYVFTGPSSTWKSVEGFSKTDLSFPSGHAVVTMAIGRCLVRLWMRDFFPELGNSTRGFLFRALPVFGVWTMVALSRFSRCLHWASDCVAGATIGFVVADLLVIGPMLANFQPGPQQPPPMLLPEPACTGGGDGQRHGLVSRLKATLWRSGRAR